MENVFRAAKGEEGVGGLGEVKGLREVVWEVAVRANDELMTARRELELDLSSGSSPSPIDKTVMPVFLAAVSSPLLPVLLSFPVVEVRRTN